MENQTFFDGKVSNPYGSALLNFFLSHVKRKSEIETEPSVTIPSAGSSKSMAACQTAQTSLSRDLNMNLSAADNLKRKLLLMASNAEECERIAIQSLIDREESLATIQKEQDDVIDRLEMEVDELAISMLANTSQPEPIRLITVAMRISNELERVGDEATTISRRSLELMKHEPLSLDMPIKLMAEMVTSMLREALDTFVYRQPDRARQIILRDKKVDALNKSIQAHMAETMLRQSEYIIRCLQYMTIAKSMERIGDHASNIAEQVVFLYEAKDIRHE
jgi:phosphate transport system protein